MNSRKITIKPNDNVPKCPKCGNNTAFNCYSDYCAEDCCEIWAECICGFKASNDAVEDVWGGVGDANCLDAIRYTWIDPLKV